MPKATGEAWGVGMTQDDMMIKDECIMVDEKDKIIGHGNKLQVHTFGEEKPRGDLHRAFSVFLFNDEGKLLLQQRAADKITFPGVWTNTCCSHPLYGFTPSEVDDDESIASGKCTGAKNAAVRKLEHELGISSKQCKAKDFKFLTRLHYWAADVVTHGPESPWGEHEVDYILFAKRNFRLKPNPEEVSDIKYVTLPELQAMMRDPDLLWSPWFRIIVEKFLVHWWKDLDATLNTDKFLDVKNVHKFDPTKEHMGGAGHAGAWLGTHPSPYETSAHPTKSPAPVTGSNGNQGLKQGSYGKVQIHKHSKFDQLSRIDEVFAGVWLTYGAVIPNKINLQDEDTKFCDYMLGKVSRSFAAVIRQLPKRLCIDILIFYLALRALDTIEDDMEAFKGKEHEKINHLNNFYQTGLVTDGWSMSDVGEGDEKTLLEQYYRCVTTFKGLSKASQEVITDITKRMGQGMASFVSKDLGQGTVTVEDYNLYCHFVAGLVGEGLSRLFHCTGYESAQVVQVSATLGNTMGLFLQKTNIIRDYLEDYVDGRAFWPQEIWKQYTTTGDLGELSYPANRGRAIHCLNHLVTDALECIPQCLEYMELLHTEEVFRFCAIPQVMAIATLSELYNNPKVFTGVVKIRKGMSAKLILDTKTRGGLHKWFNVLCHDILARIPADDPNAEKTRAICEKVIGLTDTLAYTALAGSYAQVLNSAAVVVLAVSVYCLFCGREGVTNPAGPFHVDFTVLKSKEKTDVVATGFFFASIVFIFCYSVVASGRKGLKKAD